MCGIIGYVGSRSASPILLEGLRTLEYRGYDSAGIYVPDTGVVKSVGPIAELEPKVPNDSYATSGIAHTRWATHGAPTLENAHPHTDEAETIWLVHNGIIENYQELKTKLDGEGVRFYGDTDTEVLAKLIASCYTDDIVGAVQAALTQVRGAYGIAVMSSTEPDVVVGARLGSPLVVGLSAHGNFVASDTSALLAHTKDMVYLEDGEMVVVRKDEYLVTDIVGNEVAKQIETIDWSVEAVKKDGFDHFMMKEIMEAPQVIENTLRGRLLPEAGRARLGGIEDKVATLRNLSHIQLVGCGSAYFAGSVYRYMFEEYTDLPSAVELGSEYRYKRNHPDAKSALIAISQSGETADTLASIREAKRLNMLTLGVVNVVGSTIARETDAGVYNHAGPEIAVASTKAFISQLTIGVLLTLLLGRERGTITQEEGMEIVASLQALPQTLQTVLDQKASIANIGKRYANYRDAIFMGRKLHAPIAYEGALKLKEVAYTHSEGYAGGELKHGPIAMLDEVFPVIALAPQDDVYEKMVSNIAEVKARQAPVLALVSEGDKAVKALVDDVIELPNVHPLVQPIVSTVPLHLLAYYIGIEKGYNVDRPRNLAKSVTVE